jgi:hypothetical protein
VRCWLTRAIKAERRHEEKDCFLAAPGSTATHPGQSRDTNTICPPPTELASWDGFGVKRHCVAVVFLDYDSCTRYKMNAADFNELTEAEKRHFYKCQQCGEMVDKRQLDDVLFHEDHVHRPDIQ